MNDRTNERTNFGHQPQHQITDVSAIELRLKGWGGGIRVNQNSTSIKLLNLRLSIIEVKN